MQARAICGRNINPGILRRVTWETDLLSVNAGNSYKAAVQKLITFKFDSNGAVEKRKCLGWEYYDGTTGVSNQTRNEPIVVM